MEDTERLDYSLLALPQHLHEAEDTRRLEKLLATFSFLDRKNHRFGPQAVVEDFETGLPSLAVVRDAIRLAAHVVGPGGDQLAGQLIARLMDRPKLRCAIWYGRPRRNSVTRGCDRWRRLCRRRTGRYGEYYADTEIACLRSPSRRTDGSLYPAAAETFPTRQGHAITLFAFWNVETGQLSAFSTVASGMTSTRSQWHLTEGC